jgi:hypothetical protein
MDTQYMTLADATNVFDDLLNGLADIERPTDGAVDAVGNPSRTFSELRRNVRVSIQPTTSFSRWFENNQQLQTVNFDNVIFIERDSTYTPTHKDRIVNHVVGEYTDNHSYEIQSVLNDGGEGQHWFVGANVVEL